MNLDNIRHSLETPDLFFECFESIKDLTRFSSELRHSLRQAWEQHGFAEGDLHFEASPPKAVSHSISLSHSPAGGAFAWVKRPRTVGIDIEHLPRITHGVVERISEPDEMADAPNPLWIWAAKEAAFKAFSSSPERAQVLSEISISGWQRTSDQGYVFDAKSTNGAKGKGWAMSRNEMLLAIVVGSP